MKLTTIALAFAFVAAFALPAQASFSTAAQAKSPQADHIAKKGGGKHKSGKAPKKG